MMLKKITLTNIKSYEYEEIDFSNGINCILGLNGSGKSTIIESIGLALFDFKGKNMNKMLRYNETKGSIEVEFYGADDRLYKVVRTIRKTGSTVKLIDVEHDNELYHTTSDVYAFIQKVLNIPKTKEFSKLFEEVIAVPQGQYVSAFLETSSKRKENFDRLFELDKYKETGQKLKELSDTIQKTHIRPLTEELIALKTKLEELPKLLHKKEQHEQELAKRTAKQEQDKNALAEVRVKRDEQERLKTSIDQLHSDIVRNKEKTKLLGANKQKTEEELAICRKSLDIVSKTQADYFLYERNLEEINKKVILQDQFEKKRELHSATQQKITQTQTEVKNIEATIEEKTILQKKKVEDYQAIHQDLFMKKTKLEEVSLDLKAKEENINKRKLLVEEQEVNNEKDRWFFATITNRIDALQIASHEQLEEYKKRIETNKELLKLVRDQNKLRDDLETQLNTLNTQYETNRKNSLLTVDGRCPFLNEKCKNINEGNLSSYFEEEMKKIDEERKLILQKKELLQLDKSESDVLLEIQKDQNMLDSESVKQTKLTLHVEELKNHFNIQANLKVQELIRVVETAIEEKQKRLLDEKHALEEDKKIYSKKDGECITKKLEIHHSEEKARQLDQEAKDLEKQVDQLQKSRNQKTIELKRLNEELNSYIDALNESEKTIKIIQDLRQENKDLEQQRTLYLSNLEKSKEEEKHKKTWNETTQLIQSLERETKEMEESLQELNQKHSKKMLDELTNDVQKLSQAISANEAMIASISEQLAECNQQIIILQAMEKEREAKQIDLDKYQELVAFLASTRSIFNGLPLKLSLRYRENISNMATDLYQKISRESVRIQIEEDYEVKLIDLLNQENVKVMEQLSGGEQMSVAIAIRLAMLRHLSKLDLYFLDEPTINLDVNRRDQIRDVVSEISQTMKQLFVISHDDTFDSITERIIHVEKVHNSSKVI